MKVVRFINKILPTVSPVITSYPRHANLISILSHHPFFDHWLFMNHIQLHADYSVDEYYLGFYEPIPRKLYPLVDTQKIRKDVIVKNGIDVVQFLKNAIDENFYAYMCVDTYYIAQYPLYQKYHFTHDMFVFGYDDASATFHIADFMNENRYYQAQASYEQVREAFHSEYDDSYGFNGMQLLKVDDAAKYPFDIDWILLMLEDYATGFFTSKRFLMLGDPQAEVCVYGLGIYHELIQFMYRSSNQFLVRRAFHTLSDHKKLMKLRVEYLVAHHYITNTDLIEMSAANEKLSLIIRNSYLKYVVQPSEEKLKHVEQLIRQLHDQEKEFIAQLIAELKNNRKRVSAGAGTM